MEAKELYKKHLNIHKRHSKGKHLSPNQIKTMEYEAAIDAINEALSIN